ncbi:hypothetical protein MOSE0_H00122 [Monosporozyma servazzii]
MLTINERFCVIDGWIVDIDEEEVVAPSIISSLLTPDEKKKLATFEGLKVFSDIDTSTTVIVNSASEELFHYVKTDNIEFVTMSGRVVTKNSKSHKQGRKSVIDEFTLNCHSVSLGGRNNFYIHRAVPNEVTQLASGLFEVPVKTQTEDNTAFTKVVKVQEFKFTRHDYNILKNLVLQNDSHAKYIAADMMKILKEEVSIKTISFFGRNIYRGGDIFIKHLLPETLAMFGSRISYLLLVLKCCDKLSVFSKYKSTADRVAGITKNCHTATQLAEFIAKEVSVLSEDGGDTEFWRIWVLLGAFNFSSWGNYDRICPWLSILNYRHLLKSVKWMFLFGGFIYREDKQAVVDRWTSYKPSGIDFVDKIKMLHVHFSNEPYRHSFPNIPEPQNSSPEENMSPYEIIRDSLSALTNTFDKCMEELSQWFTFADVNQLHSATIGSHDKTFKDDHSAVNILHNFGRDAFANMDMRWREQRDQSDTNILKQVKDIITDLSKLIMAMVWISTGMSMRYPVLATLAYAGMSRNIYIDRVKRKLYLNMKYDNQDSVSIRRLPLDVGVSRRLWWMIAIFQTFAIATFYNEMSLYDKRGVLDELYRDISDRCKRNDLDMHNEYHIDRVVSANDESLRQVKEDISDSSNTAASILKMFAFVDINNHRLFDETQVSDVFEVTTHRTKLTHRYTADVWKVIFPPY